jgi:protein TonB
LAWREPMPSYRDPPSRSDRAKAITAVVMVHGVLAALILTSPRVAPQLAETVRTTLITITQPPPPPPPAVPEAGRAREEEGAAGKKAEPTPVVAPKPKIVVPARPPLPAAPIAGSGSAPSAGAAAAGTGPGAGGAGSGRGGGGTGDGGGIGEDARLLSGGLTRRDYRRLRGFAIPSGRAVLAILIGPDGRVAQCSTRQSSGDPRLDAELCAIMQPRMQWSPARDRSGRRLPSASITPRPGAATEA